MKSPFPRMDPYLERTWMDVHHTFCTYARELLQPQIRPAPVARSDEPFYEGFIQIIDPLGGGRIITIIEILSITNKTPGEGARQYRQKQRETIAAGINLVEIDLLRDGDWVVFASQSSVPASKRQPYRVCVKRAEKPLEIEFYHLPLEHRLLKIPIPLRPGDPNATLDLQEMVDRTYLFGGFDTIDYKQELFTPFDPNAAAWAGELIDKRNLA